MSENFLNFTDPINRSDYLVQFLKRTLIIIIIWSFFNLLFMSWNSIPVTYDSFWESLYESDSWEVYTFLSAILFFPLEIRRARDINISINWIYLYYFLGFLPFPEDNFDVGNSISITFQSSILIFWISFSIFLFIKKGSNSKK